MGRFVCGFLPWRTWCVFAALTASFPAHGAVNVTQHHNHDSRDGLFIDSAFTPALAAGLKRDPAFDGSITGNVYAQPLYIEGGPGGRAMVIAVTESNNVYALDAVRGSVLWWTNVGPAVPAGVLPCGNITPVGITGTPVVDLPSRALFFDAMIQDTGTGVPAHFIFSLNVDTGSLNPGWPVAVDGNAQFEGTPFDSLAQGQRGALVIAGNTLYVPYGGLFDDCVTYYGWVVGVPLANPANMMAWATAAQGGGAWAVGGLATDGTDVFVATGNTMGATSWSGGEAIIRLLPDLSLPDGTMNYWAPTNWSALDDGDLDLGGSGPLLVDVPGATPSQLVAAFGKDGNVYLLDRANLGGVTQPLAQAHLTDSTIIQAAAACRPPRDLTWCLCVANGSLCSLRIGAANPPTITSAWCVSEGSGGKGRGSPFVTSTDGTNNVIVWGIGSEGDQRLHGFDGDTGTNIFTGGGTSELMAGTRRFNTGIAARGHIYVANNNKVYSFLIPGQATTPIILSGMLLEPDGSFQITFTNTPGVGFSVFETPDLTVPFASWASPGAVTEIAPGQFQFSDAPQSGSLQRFYRVSSP